jgi:hypothetical protein
MRFGHLGSVIINIIIIIIITTIQQTHQHASLSLLEIFAVISCH